MPQTISLLHHVWTVIGSVAHARVNMMHQADLAAVGLTGGVAEMTEVKEERDPSLVILGSHDEADEACVGLSTSGEFCSVA